MVAKDGGKIVAEEGGRARRAPRTSGPWSNRRRRSSRWTTRSPAASRGALALWKANDFADGVKPADAGLDAAGADRDRRPQGRQEGDGADRQEEGRRGLLRQDGRSAAGVPGQEVQPRAGEQAADRVPRQDHLQPPGHRHHRGRREPRRQLVHDQQERERLEGEQAAEARPRLVEGHLRGGVQGVEGARASPRTPPRRPTAWRSLRRRSPPRPRAAPPAPSRSATRPRTS